MRSSELDLPAGWTPERPAVWVAVDAVVIVLGLFMIIGGARSVGTEIWHLGGAFGLLGLLMVAGVAFRRRRHRVRGTAPVRTVNGVLRIRFSRSALVEGLVLTVVGAGSGVLLAVGAWEARNWVLLVMGAGAAAGGVGWLGVRYLRGISVGELQLSPDGLRLRMDGLDVHLPWEDALGLATAETRSSYGIVTGRLLTLRFRTTPRGRRPQPAVREIRVPIHRIDLDEVVLHHLLRFYHQHPEARGELAGPAAVARLRDRAFPA